MLAVVAIVALHCLILAGLAMLPPRPPPSSLIYLDLSPFAGQGERSAIQSAPALPTSETSQPVMAKAEVKPPDKTAPSPTPSRPAAPTQTKTVADDRANASTVDPVFPPPQPSEDVLAMVERITGVDALTMAQPNPLTTITEETLNEIRRQQALARADRAGGGCAIDTALRDAFVSDPVVQQALTSIPAADMSVSNALQLWDGAWTLPPNVNGAPDPLTPVRAFTTTIIAAAPPACRNALIQGPRFIIVSLHDAPPIIVVIGSGDWRWNDLLPEQSPSLFRWLGLK